MISRREPLLWLQLMALAVIPLELELLRLVLAGPGFGPAPSLERLLIWGLAVVAPGVLMWRRAPDWASLLLVRIPAAKRSVDQRRISAIQQPLGLKAALIIGIAVLLPLFWWIDRSALLVVDFSPTSDSSRLTALLIASPLLALMLWQWQQVVQAIWLLTRSDQIFADLTPINATDLQTNHLSLGLGLLQLPPLQWEAPTTEQRHSTETAASETGDAAISQSAAASTLVAPAETAETATEEILPETVNKEEQSEVIPAEEKEADDAEASADIAVIEAALETLENPTNLDADDQCSADDTAKDTDAATDQPSLPSAPDSTPRAQSEAEAETLIGEEFSEQSSGATEVSSAESKADPASVAAAIAIEPEQPPEQHDGSDLDGQVRADSTVAGTDAETHHEKPETTGSEKRDPEQPAQSPPGSA